MKQDPQMYIGAEVYLRGGELGDYRDLLNEYIKRYGEIIDNVNACLSEWNDIWDEKFDVGPFEEGTPEWNFYGQYIAMHERAECVTNNFMYLGKSRITMDTYNNRGEPKIIGIIDENPNLYFETEFQLT